MPSILFICVHNACRSQIAEAICKKLAPDWTVASAGSNPSSQVDPKAVAILQKHGLVMNSIKPKGFSELSLQEWDYVVGMGCGDQCPVVLSAKKFIEWDIPDPEDGLVELYQTLYDDLTQRINDLIQRAAGAPPPAGRASPEAPIVSPTLQGPAALSAGLRRGVPLTRAWARSKRYSASLPRK